MRASNFVTLLIVLGLTFLGLWQFSAWFRNLLGLKGRPLDFALGTGTTNNSSVGPTFGSFSEYTKAVNDVSSGWAGTLDPAKVAIPQVSRPAGAMPATRPRSLG